MENPPPAPVSTPMLWTGRILSAIPVVLLLVSAVMKFAKPPQVVDGFVHLGFPMSQVAGLGALEVFCVVVYLIPSTSVLGAILITAYMGGATCATLRAGDAFYGPVIIGILAWAGLYLRDRRLRALIPCRRV